MWRATSYRVTPYGQTRSSVAPAAESGHVLRARRARRWTDAWLRHPQGSGAIDEWRGPSQHGHAVWDHQTAAGRRAGARTEHRRSAPPCVPADLVRSRRGESRGDAARTDARHRETQGPVQTGGLRGLRTNAMSRADRFFRYLLRLFPAEFRGDFGDQMAATFSDQRRDELARGGFMGALRFWWDTVRGIMATAPREHLDVVSRDVGFALRTLRRQ